MTDLTRPVTRVTLAPHRGRRLVVTLDTPDLLVLRPQRTRQAEVVSIAAVYDFAVKLRVAREKWERQQLRKEKRK